ncbi:MAG: polysaccharide deacetylase family protein [Solirubrobacterales bacterium]
MKKYITTLISVVAMAALLCSCSAKTPNVKQNEQEAPAVPQQQVKVQDYLPILGESKNLTVKEKQAMSSWRAEVVEFAKNNKELVYINGPVNEKKVALTFDDGPDGNITPKILDVLKEKNVNASFFFIGQSIDLYPIVVKRTYNEGNLVLNHSVNHLDLSKKSASDIEKEFKGNEDKIFNLINKRPAIVRPPFGAINQQEAAEVEKLSCKAVIWSIDTLDWSQKESSNITKNVLANVRNGDIILMHSNGDKKATLEALPGIIDGLKNKGFTIVTLDKLLNINAYK